MTALDRRALLAAASPGVMGAVNGHLAADAAAERTAAAQLLRKLFDADYLWHEGLRNEGAAGLAVAIERPGDVLTVRLAVLESLGAAGHVDAHTSALLSLDPSPPTLAESAARVHAAGRLKAADRREAAVAFFEALPLDVPADAEASAEAGTVAFEQGGAAPLLSRRLQRKIAAGIEVRNEIAAMADLPREAATPALLEAHNATLDDGERLAFAEAAEKVLDPRLVPALATLLDPHGRSLRDRSIDVLIRIDTDDAARALQPHLAEEPDLGQKLRLAEFLGRHGLRDGYAYALEHMSSGGLREQAISALAAIRDPRAVAELRSIWKSSNDLDWDSAAIRALGALGDKESAAAMLALAQGLKGRWPRRR